MLEDGVAFHSLKNIGPERKLGGIRSHIHSGHGKQIKVDIAIHHSAGAADTKIPAAQWKVLGFPRIHDERGWRLYKTTKSIAPVA